MPTATGYTSESLVAAEKATTGSDLSARAMLEQIFGPIADNPLAAMNGGNVSGDILGTIFMFINMGLLTLGGIYLAYKALSAVTQTAHDGDFMGKSFNSVWVPIRITTGIFSLIPIVGGWSILQVFMLWFGIMGAGLGNMAWQGVVGAGFLPTKTLTLAPPTGGSTDKRFVPELFNMHACVAANNAAFVGFKPNGDIKTLGDTDQKYGINKLPEKSYALGEWSFGSNNGTGAECGKITLASLYKAGSHSNGKPWGGQNDLGIQFASQQDAISAAAQAQFEMIDAEIQKLANEYVNNIAIGDYNILLGNQPDLTAKTIPPDPVMLRDMAVRYQANLSNAVAGAMSSTDALPDAMLALKKHATEDGFTTAGAWYMTMAQTSYAMNSLTQNISPSISSTAQPPKPDDSIWGRAYRMINEADKSAQIGSKSGGKMGDQDATWKLVMGEMGESTWSKPGQSIVNWLITESSGKPVMLRIKDVADSTIALASAVVTAVGAVDGALNKGLTGLAVSTFGGAAVGAAQPWINMIIFICQLSIGFFLMCSIYLPMIPFIVFMGQVLNWLITVVEGVAAAPFLGFAHLDTDGEGLGHKTQYGYVFMLKSFMTPVMLVLGFVFACMLLEVIGGFVMAIYPTAMANAQMNSMTGFFSILGFIAIFMLITYSLINTSMSTMYLLPDAIFQFIGATSSATSQAGRHEAANAEKAALGGAAISRVGQPHHKDRDDDKKGRGQNGLEGAAA